MRSEMEKGGVAIRYFATIENKESFSCYTIFLTIQRRSDVSLKRTEENKRRASILMFHQESDT